jgi:hypothetical protein
MSEWEQSSLFAESGAAMPDLTGYQELIRRPPQITESRRAQLQVSRQEWLRCALHPAYFVEHFVYIEDVRQQQWVKFGLWAAQREALQVMQNAQKLVVLKARQLGLSWLSLAYALWLMLFRGPSAILLFSVRETEAKELLRRLGEMYRRLPEWMQARKVIQDSVTVLELSTGSRALAFSTGNGRSYSGTLAIVDEADFVPDLSAFLNAVKPTVDGGGQLFLISTADKRRPMSTFKALFRTAGKQEAGDYEQIFLPWMAHPGRDAAWHAKTRAEMFAQRGSDDDFFAEYPSSPEEALAPEKLDRRIPLAWLKSCYQGDGPLLDALALQQAGAPPLTGLYVFAAPQAGRRYVIGADPAEGNPNSDDSALTVLDRESWAEVASLAVKVEPGLFAAYLAQVAKWYNDAAVLVERNNHGHSVLLALDLNSQVELLRGLDHKPGWLNNVKGKPLLYSALAEAMRDGSCVVRTLETFVQLGSIQASNLSAPPGIQDDRAMSYALALAALAYGQGQGTASTVVAPVDLMANLDRRW